MPERIGIIVSTSDTFSHVIGLARAARVEGKQIEIFFTGEGVHLTRNRLFPELLEIARVGVCEVSYLANGYKKEEIPGLKEKDFVTQARNAEMVEDCDRYLTL